MKQKFFQKNCVKNLIITIIPVIISVIGIIISLVKVTQNTKVVLIIVNIMLLIFLIFFVIYYSRAETNFEELLNKIKKDFAASNCIVITYKNLYEEWAKNIYDCVGLIKKNELNNMSWNKTAYYQIICSQCRNMINSYCKEQESAAVSVNFVEYTIGEDGEKYIEMVADSNPQATHPSAYEKIEKLSESRYHHADLIRNNYRGIETAINNEEILRIFNKISIHTNLSRYTQYIAIPIYCKNDKPLGIFQVVSEYNYIIESEEKLLVGFAEKNLISYVNLILLVDKIHKGLYAAPENV